MSGEQVEVNPSEKVRSTASAWQGAVIIQQHPPPDFASDAQSGNQRWDLERFNNSL